jgi:anti-sigma factor RsiW
MECDQAHRLIHEYLDEDINSGQEQELKRHLTDCSRCRGQFQAFQQTIALVQSASHVYAPAGFSDQVLARLPKEQFIQRLKKRMQHHPLLVAATLFLLLMGTSAFSLWIEGDENFQLIAKQPEKLEVDSENHMVIVPTDSVINGDIIVRNANVSVKGRVEGNVVAIDGRIYLASTGSISGERTEIDEAVEWVWYKLKSTAYHVVP